MIGKKKKEKKLSREQQQIELGKKLQAFYETGYVDKNQALLFSLLKGMAAGVGGVLGATVVIALLLWVLSLFSQVPFLSEFSNKVQTTIEQGSPAKQ